MKECPNCGNNGSRKYLLGFSTPEFSNNVDETGHKIIVVDAYCCECGFDWREYYGFQSLEITTETCSESDGDGGGE